MSNRSGESLGAALLASSVPARVEARDGLAVLTVTELTDVVSRRREVVALARSHGFTHVCVELLSEDG